MDIRRFTTLVAKARARQDQLLKLKGADYTGGNEDRLNNFKESARALNLTDLEVWAVYFLKHIAAITTYVKDGKVQSENIKGRIDDAINYLYLLEGLIDDKRAFLFPVTHGKVSAQDIIP